MGNKVNKHQKNNNLQSSNTNQYNDKDTTIENDNKQATSEHNNDSLTKQQDKKNELTIAEQDTFTVFGFCKSYESLLQANNNNNDNNKHYSIFYNIPDLVIYCIISYYFDDGEYFRICDQDKVKIEYDSKRAITYSNSSIYGSHIIHANNNKKYEWIFKINQCYMMVIGIVDWNCTKTGYDYTCNHNSYGMYNDGKLFNRQCIDVGGYNYHQFDTIKMVLHMKKQQPTLSYCKYPSKYTFASIPIDITDCKKFRMAVALYTHKTELFEINSSITLIDFNVQQIDCINMDRESEIILNENGYLWNVANENKTICKLCNRREHGRIDHHGYEKNFYCHSCWDKSIYKHSVHNNQDEEYDISL
eukprot:427780_1